MSDLSTNIIVKLVNNVTAPIKNIIKDFEDVKTAGEKAGKAFDWGMKLNQSAEGLRKLADGAKSFTEGPIELAKTMEVSFVKLQSKMKMTDADFSKYKTQVKDLAKGTEWTNAQMADALSVFASKQFTANEAVQQMPKMLDLAEAHQMSLAEATTLTTTIMRKFGAGAAEAGKYTDILTMATSISGGKIQDIGGSLEQAGTAAKRYKMSFAEAAGLTALFSRGLSDTAAGGAAFNAMMEKFSNPRQLMMISKGMKEAFGQNISPAAMIEKMKNIPALLAEVTEKTKGKDDRTRGLIFKMIFGSAEIADIVKNVGVSGIKDATDKIANVTGNTAEKAEKMHNTAESAASKHAAAVNRLKETMGESMMERLKNYHKWVGNIVEKVSGWAQAHGELTNVIMGGAQVGGGVAGAGATVLEGASGLMGLKGIFDIGKGLLAKRAAATAAGAAANAIPAAAVAGEWASTLGGGAVAAKGGGGIAALLGGATLATIATAVIAAGAVTLAGVEIYKHWSELNVMEGLKGIGESLKDGVFTTLGRALDPRTLLKDLGIMGNKTSEVSTISGDANKNKFQGEMKISLDSEGKPKSVSMSSDEGLNMYLNTGFQSVPQG